VFLYVILSKSATYSVPAAGVNSV